MSEKVVFNVKIEACDRHDMIVGLVHTADKVVCELDEDTRKEMLMRLVVHGILQDAGKVGHLDAVDLLQDCGLYIGKAARKRMMD